MAKFNLGRLKNIGFELAEKDNRGIENSYYVLSDIDMLPSYNLVEDYLKYPKNPIHLANLGTRYSEDGSDADFLGGVVSFNDTDLSVQDAMSMVLSGGIIAPDSFNKKAITTKEMESLDSAASED